MLHYIDVSVHKNNRSLLLCSCRFHVLTTRDNSDFAYEWMNEHIHDGNRWSAYHGEKENERNRDPDKRNR